jgi:hypothetical protein
LQAAAFGSSDGGKTSLAGGAVVRKTNTPLFLLIPSVSLGKTMMIYQDRLGTNVAENS